jgi:hypothetical protein
MSGELLSRVCVTVLPRTLARVDDLAARLRLSRSAAVDASLRFVLDNFAVIPADNPEGERHG